MLVGWLVGAPVGPALCETVGLSDGDDEGLTKGPALGVMVGFDDGDVEGSAEGI